MLPSLRDFESITATTSKFKTGAAYRTDYPADSIQENCVQQ
jgi:hypothetical protein